MTSETVSLKQIAASVPGVRVITEARVGDWAAWSLIHGDRSVRVERPRLPSDTHRVEPSFSGWRPDDLPPEREHEIIELDVTAAVPAHHWSVNSGGEGAATFRAASEIIDGVCQVLCIPGVYRFAKSVYHGTLYGMFIANASDVFTIIGKTIVLGDVFGKYSSVVDVIDCDDITLVSRDPVVIAAIRPYQVGHNPVLAAYCEHEQFWDECSDCSD